MPDVHAWKGIATIDFPASRTLRCLPEYDKIKEYFAEENEDTKKLVFKDGVNQNKDNSGSRRRRK